MEYKEIIMVHSNATTEEDLKKFRAEVEKLMKEDKVWQMWGMLVPKEE